MPKDDAAKKVKEMGMELGKLDMSPEKIPYGGLMIAIHKNMPHTGYPVTVTHVSGVFWAAVGLWAAAGSYGACLIVNSLAILYPAMMSCRAERDRTAPTQWLSYWIIYSSFFIVEFSPGFSRAIPLYYLIKLVLLLWCMYPGKGNGAEILYTVAIRPVFTMLDKALADAAKGKHVSIGGLTGAVHHDNKERAKQHSKEAHGIKKSGSKDSLGKFK